MFLFHLQEYKHYSIFHSAIQTSPIASSGSFGMLGRNNYVLIWTWFSLFYILYKYGPRQHYYVQSFSWEQYYYYISGNIANRRSIVQFILRSIKQKQFYDFLYNLKETYKITYTFLKVNNFVIFIFFLYYWTAIELNRNVYA